MRKLASACFCLVGVLGACESSMAQNRMSDVPDAFFGAQRGKVVAHPNGGFRMHYGRGLTPQGAAVITTGINVVGPLIPQIIGAVAVPMAPPGSAPMQTPAPQAAPTTQPPAAAPGCDTEDEAPADTTLDRLVSPEEHEKHRAHLENMLARLKPVVERAGGTFDPGPQEPSVARPGTVPPTTPLDVRGGVRVTPPAPTAPDSARLQGPAPQSEPTPQLPQTRPDILTRPTSGGEPVPVTPTAPTSESENSTAPNGDSRN